MSFMLRSWRHGDHVRDKAADRHLRPGPRPRSDDVTLGYPVGATGCATGRSQTGLPQHGEGVVLGATADIGDGDMGPGSDGQHEQPVGLVRLTGCRLLLEHPAPERTAGCALDDVDALAAQTPQASCVAAAESDDVRRDRQRGLHGLWLLAR